jgi:hypothetical protein
VGSTLALAQPHYYNRLVQLASTIFGTISSDRSNRRFSTDLKNPDRSEFSKTLFDLGEF